jgi:hypothetical protein
MAGGRLLHRNQLKSASDSSSLAATNQGDDGVALLRAFALLVKVTARIAREICQSPTEEHVHIERPANYGPCE